MHRALVDSAADGQLRQDPIQQAALFETTQRPGESIAQQDSLQLFPLTLRCRVVDQRSITLHRRPQLSIGAPPLLSLEPDRAQHTQRVVPQRFVRDQAQHTPINIATTAERIEQKFGQVSASEIFKWQGHRVDREVSTPQIALDVVVG